MLPKFAVGEVVLLRSKDYPEKDGEFTVLNLRFGLWRSNADGVLREGWSYWLDDGDKDPWAETALRKKHTPGELSFEDLMFSLSSPKVLTHDPQ